MPAGFAHWLLMFDGVDGNRDKELAHPFGYGRIEHAYARAHFDFNLARAYSHEGELEVMCRLRLPNPELVEQFRRAVFNIVADLTER